MSWELVALITLALAFTALLAFVLSLIAKEEPKKPEASPCENCIHCIWKNSKGIARCRIEGLTKGEKKFCNMQTKKEETNE